MTTTRILLIGRAGQVAQALAERAAARDGLEVSILSRPDIDLSRPEGLAMRVAEHEPGIVVNAAAYTAVDRAEEEEALATIVNGDAVRELALGAERCGAPFVHISTDYVFDGTGERPWRPDDPTAPLNAYGRSKLAGEASALASGANATIIRTAWVYSPFGANFVKTMLRLAKDRDRIDVVGDQRGNPTSAFTIADGVLAALPRLLDGDEATRGIFHLTGAGSASWASFAEEIFRQAGERGLPTATVRPIGTDAFPTPARRPANSMLASDRFADVFGHHPLAWERALAETMDRLAKAPE